MTEDEQILTAILKCRPIDIIVNDKYMNDNQLARYKDMTSRRASGEPLQYIIGNCDFMGVTLYVDKRVLIPRPETELLVDHAIAKSRSLHSHTTLDILDIGTGSGNIAVTLAKNISNSSITAIDVSDDVLAVALKNAKTNGVEQKIQFHCKDMSKYFINTKKREKNYDMIISNPPYIQTSQLRHLPVDVQWEPQSALDGGRDGLEFIRKILNNAYTILKPDGILIVEIGDGQRENIEKIINHYPQYLHTEFHKDYVGTDRFVTVRT